MGRRKSRRQVVTAPRARRDLSAIFEYNEVHRGLRDATRYARFLEDQIESLEDDWYLGLSIEGHPGLR
jgi:plasmid stabilization system protein ParE